MAAAVEKVMAAALQERRQRGLLRGLSSRDGSDGLPLIDFCSNDYLGLARDPVLRGEIDAEAKRAAAELAAAVSGSSVPERAPAVVGSSGSRLLSGNNAYAELVETELAAFFRRPAAQLFNSGYDANLALMSCLPQKGDVVLFDELCHNSLREGMRLGRQRKTAPFKHNDPAALRARLRELAPPASSGKCVYVVVESVYSMDGDKAPLRLLCDIAAEQGPNVCVVCDEAHATGVFGPGGRGVVAEAALEQHPALLCSVHTCGKALGCHGAVVAGSATLQSYLLNYGRSLIYTTALPLHGLAAIRCAVRYQAEREELRDRIRGLIALFASALRGGHPRLPAHRLLATDSPIQAVLAPGNERVVAVARELRRRGFDALAIRAPTVPVGTERLRVVLHAHNTEKQVRDLVQHLCELISGSEPPAARL
eukprot:TRINITY_DN55043_c0_g1_i1.p1 TRINITY_DN55043_c0_g1~~TRINITY_DN55043_c0_g1_i1.p1  ORF type:complete len:447 (+),score=156.74 TRINITY_DN55043_c0_g1_i1:72-1343(+)